MKLYNLTLGSSSLKVMATGPKFGQQEASIVMTPTAVWAHQNLCLLQIERTRLGFTYWLLLAASWAPSSLSHLQEAQMILESIHFHWSLSIWNPFRPQQQWMLSQWLCNAKLVLVCYLGSHCCRLWDLPCEGKGQFIFVRSKIFFVIQLKV